MLQSQLTAYPSERSINGSEDQKSLNFARPALQRSSIDRAACGRRGTQRITAGAPFSGTHWEVHSKLHPRAAVTDGGDAHRANARADFTDRVQRRLRRRIEFQPRFQATLQHV